MFSFKVCQSDSADTEKVYLRQHNNNNVAPKFLETMTKGLVNLISRN